jgi:hypothetical protein
VTALGAFQLPDGEVLLLFRRVLTVVGNVAGVSGFRKQAVAPSSRADFGK